MGSSDDYDPTINIENEILGIKSNSTGCYWRAPATWLNPTTGDWIYSSPVIADDGTIYVGSYDNNLYAINPDGTQQWEFLTGSNVKSSPALGTDGTLFVDSADGKLYAINESSGGLSSDASWPMFHRDLEHTGQASCPWPLGPFPSFPGIVKC